MLPTIFKKNDNNDPQCVILLNVCKDKVVTLKVGTVLGQLFETDVLTPQVEVFESVELLMTFLTNMYTDHHDGDQSPPPASIMVGPVFNPTEEELQTLQLNCIQQASSLYHIEYGPDIEVATTSARTEVVTCSTSTEVTESAASFGTAEVNSVNNGDSDFAWDINPELSEHQQTTIRNVLIKHKSVFITSLKELLSTWIGPYRVAERVGNDVYTIKKTWISYYLVHTMLIKCNFIRQDPSYLLCRSSTLRLNP